MSPSSALAIRLDVTPHPRHKFCKVLVNAGVGLETMEALARHESMESTRTASATAVISRN